MDLLGIALWLSVGIMLIDLGISDYETKSISSYKLMFYIIGIGFLTSISISQVHTINIIIFLILAIVIIGFLLFFRLLANADIIIFGLGLFATFIPFIAALTAYFAFIALDAYSNKGRFIPALAYMCGCFWISSIVLMGVGLWQP